MANPVGFRFRPTDEEIINHYLRPKNQGTNTSHVDRVISTVNICSFDPWELPSQSSMESREDEVWYFFGPKEKKYSRGERRSRKTKSGFWKITGKPMEITRKRGNREKIGEKRVLVFQSIESGSKTNWVMHEYHDDTPLSPDQMTMTYTLCKVKLKGQEMEISSSSSRSDSHSLINHMNHSGGVSTGSPEVAQSQTLTGSEGSSFECRELGNPRQFSGFLDEQEEAQIGDAVHRAFDSLSPDDWRSLFNDDDEQGKITFMQQDRSDYRPKKSLTSVFIGHTSDDSDSDSMSATTSSIQTSSTCDSFGSSIHRIHQITELQESPKKVCQAQGTDIGDHKLGQESTKNKRAGFFYRIIQRFIKKIQLCCSSSISR